MNITTKTLSGAEICVAIGGQNTEIRNDGAATVYASANPSIVAGADGVVAIPAGAAVTVLDTRGKVYLLGTGEASLVGKDTVSAVFKCAPSAGGSGEDDVARQAITAHAGNAEIHVTADEKAKWNAVNYSNPNLLINPDFRINQRGKSSYDTGGYTVDMWTLLNGNGGNGIVTVVDDGLICSKKSGATGNSYFVQTIENSYIGEQVTLTVCIDGSEHSVTATIPGTGESTALQLENGRWYMTVVRGHLQVCCRLTENSNITNYVKLEFGSMATRFCDPDTATELAKCQRYYQIRSTGDIAEVDLRPSMRATPTITQLSDGNYAYSAEL